MASLEVRKDYYVIVFYSANQTPSKKKLVFKKANYTKKRILEIKAELELRYKTGDFNPWLQDLDINEPEARVPSISTVIEEYISEKSKSDWANTTAIHYQGRLRRFSRELEGMPVDRLTIDKVNDYINRPGLAYDTKHSEKRMLTTLVRYLGKKGYVELPAEQIKVYALHKPDSAIKYISLADQRKLERYIYKKVRKEIRKGYQTHEVNSMWLIDFMRWQRYSGMRISETLRLRVRDIDTVNWRITIRQTKAGKVQYLHIAEVAQLRKIAMRKIRQAKANPNALLFNKKNSNYVAKQFRVHRDEALPGSKATVHTFRHTCAIDLLKAGVDIYRVMRWLRHADVSTTMIYADMLGLDVACEVGRAFSEKKDPF